MLNFMYLWIYKPFIEVGLKGAKIDIEWVEFVEKDLILKVMENFKLNNNLYKIYMHIFIIRMIVLLLFVVY